MIQHLGATDINRMLRFAGSLYADDPMWIHAPVVEGLGMSVYRTYRIFEIPVR